MSAYRVPKIGEIWKDLDPRPEYQRCVRISEVRAGDGVRIYGVELQNDGTWAIARNPHSGRPVPERWAKLERFNGKKGGYGFHLDAPLA